MCVCTPPISSKSAAMTGVPRQRQGCTRGSCRRHVTATASGLHTVQLSQARYSGGLHTGQLSETRYCDSVRLHTGQLSEARYSGGLRTGPLLGARWARGTGGGGGGAPPCTSAAGRERVRGGARGQSGARRGMRGRAGEKGSARGRMGKRRGVCRRRTGGRGGAQGRAGERQQGPQKPHGYITAGDVKYTGWERAPHALMGSGGALGSRVRWLPPPPRSMGVGGH